MSIRVCFVGDDVRPPWNHASSILTKRLIECLSPAVDCTLATASSKKNNTDFPTGVDRLLITDSTGTQGLDAVKLSLAVRKAKSDILHLVGTNALVFSPLSKLLRVRGKIVRHIFTPYDSKDLVARPARWVANKFFIDSYAFTTPWIGRWAAELSTRMNHFLLRPPINCDFYRPVDVSQANSEPVEHEHTLLYMGPLMPSRFPEKPVLRALKALVKRGLDVRLVVLTSATRTSPEHCERVLALSRDLSIAENVVLKRVDLSEEDRILWYNRADVVLFPYVGPEPEKLADPPFGILESMACGRIVLAADVLSVAEVVEEGVTGFLLSSVEPEVLERGLLRAMDESLRKRIQMNARTRILEKFDYPRIRDRAVKGYLDTLG